MSEFSTTSHLSSRNWLPNRDQLTTLLYMLVIVALLLGGWEGFKALGRATDYQLEVGSIKISLRTANDLNMPPLRQIIRAFSEPAQRQGRPLIEVLLEAALFTARNAFLGFVLGTLLGLLLAVIFAHSSLIERGLMPFVIASQTVPILAIAPAIVIWAGRERGVPIIAAYLAFFPVTIYALRGLSDVPQTALELMQSYAANRWEILLKLRIPNAVPYIFTALKITAPASVVGAVIGELPSGIQEGLGGAIINYAQYYTSGPAKLWATNIVTALVGILFFVIIAIIERWAVRWKPSSQ